MALPTTVLSDVGLEGHHPPFKSSGGAFYSVVRVDADELDVYKATDPTSSWAIQDSGNGPVHAGTILGFACVQDGDVIHMIAWASDRHEYYTFNMATDLWAIDESITDTDIQTTPPTFPWASIAVRSDGDIVVVYAGETDANMGNEKERVDVNIRTGGTWGGPVALDAGGDVHYGNPNIIKASGTDDTHIIFQRTSDTADDPPVSFNSQRARTLDPSDGLSSVIDAGGPLFSNVLGQQNTVSYDDSSTERMISVGVLNDGGLQFSRVSRWEEDGSNDIIASATAFKDITATDAFANGVVGIITMGELSGDLHILFSGGGDDGVDQDLYYTKSTDDALNWDTPTEEIDAITVNFISANIYVRGADTVMAYVYDDAGTQKYNEKVLIAGAAGFPYHAFKQKRRDMRTLLTL